VVFYLLFVFSLFYRFLEENEAFLEVSGLKSKFGKAGDFVSAINRTKPMLERTNAQAPKPRNEHSLHLPAQEERSIAAL
jgi:hypothetical protein